MKKSMISFITSALTAVCGTGTLTNWKNGDLCKDNRIDVFDIIEARKEFLRS
ncbi:MAG TPA: hypothetical protein PLH98_17960 [Ruminococcus flavefaciens]|mgnify:CR=1 FL=1|nr:hypothetical protein [Ruminococcus flavefaciens]